MLMSELWKQVKPKPLLFVCSMGYLKPCFKRAVLSILFSAFLLSWTEPYIWARLGSRSMKKLNSPVRVELLLKTIDWLKVFATKESAKKVVLFFIAVRNLLSNNL